MQFPTGLGASAATAAATGGTSVPWQLIAALAGSGALGGFLSMGDSPQDEATKQALANLKKYMDTLQTPAYSKGEIESQGQQMQDRAGGAANIAAGAIGSSLSEGLAAGGVPQGQPSASIYTSELAPVIAQGERDKNNIQQQTMELWANLDNTAKARLLSALGLEGQLAGQLPDMNDPQKFLSGFLNTSNIAATGYGNIAQLLKNLNYQPVKP